MTSRATGTAALWQPGGRRVLAVVVLVMAFAAPAHEAAAGPDQQAPTAAEQQKAEVNARQGEVAIEVDVLNAQVADVQAALATLDANVTTQQAEFDAASGAAETAAAELVAAEAAVTDAQFRVDALNLASDALLTEAYIGPPAETAMDTLSAESMSDALVMHAVIEMQADQDKSVMELLSQARDDLTAERENRAVAATAAEDTRVLAEQELGEATAAREQQAAFAAEAEAALDHKLTEAENLATIDAQLSAQIAAEQAEAARLAEEARRAAEAAAAAANQPPPDSGPGTVIDVAGDLASVSCYTGGHITVADSIAGSTQAMLDAAHGDGVDLCGGGYRDPAAQIALREAHCGSGYYNIYQKPASQCHPPTARPGTSMHEQGLAIDFANCSTRSTACYRWLNGHAAGFGFYNLPSEPWHWSINGN
jgi:LAS superfamily LD-carboxypeptidase LdcB